MAGGRGGWRGAAIGVSCAPKAGARPAAPEGREQMKETA
jgi:hypothetical protein